MKKHTTLKAKINSAFSLVELLVVIAVIAIIVAIALPNLLGIRESAEQAKLASNLDEAERVLKTAQTWGFTGATLAEVQSGVIYTNLQTNRVEDPATPGAIITNVTTNTAQFEKRD